MTASLRKLLDRTPTGAEISALVKSIETDSERSAAVVAAAVLEDILRNLIRKNMVNLTKDEDDKIFKGAGPLATLSNKVQFAYALGLFGRKTRHDLRTMIAIRNLFAHATQIVNFNTPEVRDAFAGLHCRSEIVDINNHPPQMQFASVTRILLIKLINKIDPTTFNGMEIRSLD